jgi:hypothetical protein
MVTILLAAVTLLQTPQQPAAARRTTEFVPVAVRYEVPQDPRRRRADLETMSQLRFNAVASTDESASQTRLSSIDGLLRGDATSVMVPSAELGVVTITAAATAAEIRAAAWWHLARGARGIVFHDWDVLRQNDAALGEAAAFADAVTRNQELYLPLRHADKTGARVLAINGPPGVEAEWLESPDALMLIAINRTAEPREVTFVFSPDMPEAIWQNMLTGAAVNFVAGSKGPEYVRAFAPGDVLVLMIRKRWR